MTIFASRLSLPTPSAHLLTLIDQHISDIEFDPDNKRWLDEFHGNNINSVSLYFTGAIWVKNPDSSALQQQAKLEFGSFFPKHQIRCTVGVYKSVNDQPACLPPHIDRGRAVALTYFHNLGGDVETVFYNRVEIPGQHSVNVRYSDLTEVARFKFSSGWWAYPVNRCHSAENIVGTRSYMALKLTTVQDPTNQDPNYTIEDLHNDYPELFL